MKNSFNKIKTVNIAADGNCGFRVATLYKQATALTAIELKKATQDTRVEFVKFAKAKIQAEVQDFKNNTVFQTLTGTLPLWMQEGLDLTNTHSGYKYQGLKFETDPNTITTRKTELYLSVALFPYLAEYLGKPILVFSESTNSVAYYKDVATTNNDNGVRGELMHTDSATLKQAFLKVIQDGATPAVFHHAGDHFQTLVNERNQFLTKEDLANVTLPLVQYCATKDHELGKELGLKVDKIYKGKIDPNTAPGLSAQEIVYEKYLQQNNIQKQAFNHVPSKDLPNVKLEQKFDAQNSVDLKNFRAEGIELNALDIKKQKDALKALEKQNIKNDAAASIQPAKKLQQKEAQVKKLSPQKILGQQDALKDLAKQKIKNDAAASIQPAKKLQQKESPVKKLSPQKILVQQHVFKALEKQKIKNDAAASIQPAKKLQQKESPVKKLSPQKILAQQHALKAFEKQKIKNDAAASIQPAKKLQQPEKAQQNLFFKGFNQKNILLQKAEFKKFEKLKAQKSAASFHASEAIKHQIEQEDALFALQLHQIYLNEKDLNENDLHEMDFLGNQ